MNGYLIAIIGLVLCSTFFSGTETAFSSVSKIKMKNLAADDNKRAELVLELTENFDKLITTILVGNTISNIVMTTVATVYGIITWGSRIGPTVATIMVTILVLVLGEISPKIIAREYAEEVALFLAPFVKGLIIILTPLTFIFMGLKVILKKMIGKNDAPEFSEDELLTIVEEAEAGGAIGEEQSELISNAIEFNETEAIDILTPRVDIVAIEKGTPVAEIKEVFRESGLSRLPVYEDDLDHIIGVINQKDFYNKNVRTIKDTEKIIKPVAYVAESIKASVLLKKMQAKKTHIAIVVDEYGGTSGIVTLEDIIEEIVGEITDEYDKTELPFRKLDEDTFVFEAKTSIIDFCKTLDLDDEEFDEVRGDAETLAGLILEVVGEIPQPGTNVKIKNLNFVIQKSDNRRIEEVKVTIEKPSQDED